MRWIWGLVFDDLVGLATMEGCTAARLEGSSTRVGPDDLVTAWGALACEEYPESLAGAGALDLERPTGFRVRDEGGAVRRPVCAAWTRVPGTAPWSLS